MCLACQLTNRMTVVEQEHHHQRSEWLWAELGVLRERMRLSSHPYVAAWERRELSPSDLVPGAGRGAGDLESLWRFYDCLEANRVQEKEAA
jgi:hypothetical protein